MNSEVIIVLGLSPTAKYVAKEAYKFRIKCFAFDFKKGAAFYSKYFEKKEILSELELLDKLETEYLNNGSIYYVCPTSDEWIAFINKNKNLFINTNLKTSLSYLDHSYRLLADKLELLKLSSEVNLNYPKSIVFTLEKEKRPNISNLQFPIFIKPTDRTGLSQYMNGKKGWLFNTFSEWQSFQFDKKLKEVKLLAQEVVVGRESNIKVLGTVAHNGQKYNSWVGIKCRQYPQGFGSASMVIESSDHELESIADSLLKKVNYSGFFALETKYCDLRKKTFIIEVNARPGLWFGATTTSECYFVIQWLNSFKKEKIEIKLPSKLDLNHKVVWRYFYKNSFAVAQNGFSQNYPKLEKPKYIKNSYAVFDLMDLRPFVFDLINSIKKIVRYNL